MPEALATPGARALFERMARKRVLVVGDVMLDEWVWGRVSRISPEAPVPVVAVDDHSFTLGGAGNVANNLRAIGAEVSFAGAVGDDAEGRRVVALLDAIGVERSGVVTLEDRPTTRKTRIVAHNQQVVRADWESTQVLAAADRIRLAALVARAAANHDAVVLSDYAKGLFSRDLVEAARACEVVTADPKPRNITLFGGVTCVAPNAAEASEATGIPIRDDASLDRAGSRLARAAGLQIRRRDARREGNGAVRRRRRTDAHSVGSAHGLRRERRGRYGHRSADARPQRRRSDPTGGTARELRGRRGRRETRDRDGFAERDSRAGRGR